jgi:murein DD-endopeptidase MepM/ murein hydrolase activator NlpD
VPSPTFHTDPASARATARPRFRVAATSLAVLAVLGATLPQATADDLDDDRRQVRHALAERQEAIEDSRDDVAQAAESLEDARARLDAARADLADVQRELKAARRHDVEIAVQLAAAEDELAASRTAVADGRAQVAAQRALIGSVVREAYQQQTPLVQVGILLGSDSPDELADRLQWTDQIFDSTAADLDHLNRLQELLLAAEQRQASAEALLAERKAASEAQVAEVKRLTAKAASRKAEIARLVQRTADALADAEASLEADQAAYDRLEAEEARITARIKAQIAADGGAGNVHGAWGFIKPVDAPAGSGFGMRMHPILHYRRMHWGTDFGASCGAPLYAMADGKVTSAGWTTVGFGYYTIISYGRRKGVSISSGYAHQSKIIVRAGQQVKQGQVVGYVGTTGLSTGCHLHLQIYRNGVRVNPMNYL